MPRILKQSLAEQDLIEIWLYTLNEWESIRLTNIWMTWMQQFGCWPNNP